RLCEPTRPSALLRFLFSAAFQAINQVAEPVRNALVHDFVVHGSELLTEAGLHVSAQLRRFRIEPLATGGRGFHRILLSHGLSFVHFSPQQIRGPGRAPAAPLVLSKTRDLADGSPGTELFCDIGVGALQTERNMRA